MVRSALLIIRNPKFRRSAIESFLLVLFDVLLKLLAVGVVGLLRKELLALGDGLVLHAQHVEDVGEAQVDFRLADGVESKGLVEVVDRLARQLVQFVNRLRALPYLRERLVQIRLAEVVVGEAYLNEALAEIRQG